MANTSYDTDIVAWANEQAALLRSGQLAAIDIEHIAEEIEDVGKREKRELMHRMAVLLCHLLKWQYQTGRRGTSWQRTIVLQRRELISVLDETPSLKASLTDSAWIARVWDLAVNQAIQETGLETFPEQFPWTMTDVLAEGWLPQS